MNYSPRVKISKHFTHYEVCKSSTANRYSIDNTPSDAVLIAAEGVAYNVLEPIRVEFGIPFSPQSWYRGELLERNITWNSFVRWAERKGYADAGNIAWDAYFSRKSHPRGEAVDIEIPSIPNDTLFNWILNNLEYDQLIREFPRAGDPFSGWVHVSWKPNGNRHQHFTI